MDSAPPSIEPVPFAGDQSPRLQLVQIARQGLFGNVEPRAQTADVLRTKIEYLHENIVGAILDRGGPGRWIRYSRQSPRRGPDQGCALVKFGIAQVETTVGFGRRDGGGERSVDRCGHEPTMGELETELKSVMRTPSARVLFEEWP